MLDVCSTWHGNDCSERRLGLVLRPSPSRLPCLHWNGLGWLAKKLCLHVQFAEDAPTRRQLDGWC